jgi:hypothetical protein
MRQRTGAELLRSLALAAAIAAGAGWLSWQALRDPEIPWLARSPRAEWILYPSAPTTAAHPAIPLDAVFRRTFVLPRRPRGARLEVRCFRQCRVAVNGAPLPLPEAADWKDARAGDPAPLLREGGNLILVRVANDSGPPALWLAVATSERSPGPPEPASPGPPAPASMGSPAPAHTPMAADGRRLASDARWEVSLAGAAWRPARLAATPMSRWRTAGSPPGPNPRPAAAFTALLPLFLAFAALGAALVWAGLVLARRRRRGRPAASPAAAAATTVAGAAGGWAALAIAALLWAALFWNNRGLDGAWGFDSEGHLDYLRAILEQGRLPLADEGWEMYQPPLYYLAAAAILRSAGHARVDAAAIGLLRAFGWCAFVVQSACLLGSLRLLFPGSPRRWLGGFCLGIFLPAQIYLLQYVTNEGWAAALSSAALYLCLRCLRRLELGLGRGRQSLPHDGNAAAASGASLRTPTPSPPSPLPFLAATASGASLRAPTPSPPSPLPFLGLGVVLGLAMLTKFSALVTVAAVAAVLAGRLMTRRVRSPGAYVRTLGAMLLGCLLLCGWHYARVAAHFHRLLVGNWDRASGFAWWQNPGYRNRLDLLRWGESLRAPLLAAFHSIPDALYSTLWGDGLLGGSGSPAVRPPWNYGLMAAGYLLALLPTVALAAGAGAALGRLARRPRAEVLLLSGALGATALAVLAMSLRVASYAQPKAFYALSAMVPLCAFGGWGLDLMAGAGADAGKRGGRWRAAAIYVLFAVWACNAFATFWMRHPDPGPLRATAAALDPAGLLARARAAVSPAEEESWLRRAIVASPDHPFAWLLLGDALAKEGRTAEAEAALREALRVDAYSAPAHAHLAQVLALRGRPQEAAYHRRLAAFLQGFRPPVT